MLLQFSGPTAHKVALDALERVGRVGQVPLFVLLGDVGVARRRLGAELALILVVVVLQEVVVDVVYHMEFGVAYRAHEQFLIVGSGGRGCSGRC